MRLEHEGERCGGEDRRRDSDCAGQPGGDAKDGAALDPTEKAEPTPKPEPKTEPTPKPEPKASEIEQKEPWQA